MSVELDGAPYMSGNELTLAGPLDLVIRLSDGGLIDNVVVTCRGHRQRDAS